MPHPGTGFPTPPFQWPHVGRQWPAYNIESDQADGLLGWWPTLASQGGDRLLDLSGHGHHATYAAGPAWSWLPQIGWVQNVNNTNYATVDMVANGTQGTLAAWVLAGASGASEAILGLYQASGKLCVIEMYLDESFRMYYLSTWAGPTAASGSGLAMPALYHVVGTWAAGTVKIFVNGTLRDSAATFTTIFPIQATIGVRRAAVYEHEYNGLIGDSRIYDVAKTDTQVYQMYTKPWELPQIPRRLWRLGVVAPPPATIVPVAMHYYRRRRV